MNHAEFQKVVKSYYAAHKRHMPWRARPTPYFVLVSELMLQQTRVSRVMPKFTQFVERFPNLSALARASLGDVLVVWSGLGYNRRAKYLWQAAKAIQDGGGVLPQDATELKKLPGVGPNTAGAIIAYAFNEPAVFVETNIRAVFIHHFFSGGSAKVTDTEIRQLVQATLPKNNIRAWYYALMDYGTHLKMTGTGNLDRVHGYAPQSRFSGSLRQIRGRVLKALLGGSLSEQDLERAINDDRLPTVLRSLIAEGMVQKRDNDYMI